MQNGKGYRSKDLGVVLKGHQLFKTNVFKIVAFPVYLTFAILNRMTQFLFIFKFIEEIKVRFSKAPRTYLKIKFSGILIGNYC